MRLFSSSKEKKYTEYDIMKYKLTNDALGIALWDMDVKIEDPTSPDNQVTWSQELRDMLGFSGIIDFPDTITALADRFHPDDSENAFAAFAAHFCDRSGETPYNIEYRLKHKNGEYRWFQGFGTTLRDGAGLPLRVAGAVMDIDEKKHAQNDLEQAAEAIERRGKMLEILNDTAVRFLSQSVETFEETMTAGMKRFCDAQDIDRVSVWRNTKTNDELHTSQIYRWDRRSGGTTKPTPGLEDVTYAQLAPRWEGLLAGGEVVNGPVTLLPEAAMLKSFGVVSALVVPVFINKDFWGFVLFEDRENERYFKNDRIDIMRSAAFLCANTVIMNEKNERDRHMTENVKTALLEAEEANRVKDEFLSRMSHEMLTPMNTITGMSQIMSINGLPDDLIESHAEIEKASRHLLRLVNDLLDMTSRKAGTFTLAMSVFSFADMFNAIMKETSPAIEEKQQTLNLDIDPAIPQQMLGDEKRLSQVITNLLLNAIKFSPEQGEIHLSARMTNEKNGIVTLQIEVKDNGIGISKEQQKGIFELFEQVDGGLTRKVGGVGLGLPLSEHIVELMGGKIWLDSELGKGSTFTFTCKFKKR